MYHENIPPKTTLSQNLPEMAKAATTINLSIDEPMILQNRANCNTFFKDLSQQYMTTCSSRKVPKIHKI